MNIIHTLSLLLSTNYIKINYFCLFTEIPEKVGEHYINLEPLEPLPAIPSNVLKGYVTSTFKASHVKTGVNYFLRRIHSTYIYSRIFIRHCYTL